MLRDPDPGTLRAIGFLFLACTHALDGQLSEAERDLVIAKMEGRLVAATERQVFEALRGALELYRTTRGLADLGAHVHEVAVDLATKMEPADLELLLADLLEMANTDGLTCPERTFISDIAQTFGLADPFAQPSSPL